MHTTLICDAGIKAILIPAADSSENGLTNSTGRQAAQVFLQETRRNARRLFFWGGFKTLNFQ